MIVQGFGERALEILEPFADELLVFGRYLQVDVLDQIRPDPLCHGVQAARFGARQLGFQVIEDGQDLSAGGQCGGDPGFTIGDDLGKILDPIVDKINVAVIMLFLAAYKQLPYWYVFFVIGRDVLIMLASIRILSKKQIISTSNIFGKITLTSYLLVILCELLQIKPANKIILWVSAVLIPVSLFKYSVFYRALMGKNRRVFSKDKENLLVNK